MEIAAVNVSMPRRLLRHAGRGPTGIDKQPQDGPVQLTPDGFSGDGVGNVKDHGGPDQAVYCYGSVDYDWWAAEGRVTPRPGLFGENLTIDGLASASLSIGDRLAVGPSVVIEVTAPRIPCATLSLRLGEGRFAKRFAAARRPGAYCRVIEGGPVAAGDQVEFVPADGPSVPLLAAQDLYYDVQTPVADLERVLAAPVAARLRTLARGRLERAG